MRNTFLSLLWIPAAILIAGSLAAVADATVVVQHAGSNDPLTEGFAKYGTCVGTVEPGNDGEDYWGIRAALNKAYSYTATGLSGFDDPEGWTATVRVRGVYGTMSKPNQVITDIENGTQDFTMGLADGTNVSWPRGLYLRGSAGFQHQGDLDPTVYHTYQMIYDPLDNTNLSVYVDGDLFVKKELSWFLSLVYSPGIWWGDMTSVEVGDHHWAFVQVETGVHIYSTWNFPGDADRNGTVDLEDAAILADNWLASSATWGMGDFDGDNVVDDIDATIMAVNWGNTPQGGTAVPEPTVLTGIFAVALAACLTLLRRGR